MQVIRPVDKAPLRQDGRLKLEWDAFFNSVQTLLTQLQVTGTATLAAAASTSIADARVGPNSHIQLQATNAAAGALDVYVANQVAGVGFDVRTASGAAAAGTETFSYWVVG